MLFRGTAKFFAGLRKALALELCGGTETAVRCAFLNPKRKSSAKQNDLQCRAQRMSAEAVPSTSGRKEEYGDEPDSLIHCGEWRDAGLNQRRMGRLRRHVEEQSFQKRTSYVVKSIQWHSAVLSERLRAMRLIGTDVEGGARSVWHARSICFRRRQYGGAIQQVDHSKCRQHSGCDPLFLGEQKPNELLDGCE